MELQRVLAHNTKQALEQVHKLYGDNALLVSNRRNRDKTEVIVAVDLAEDTETAINELQVAAVEKPSLEDSGNREFQSVMESDVFAAGSSLKTSTAADISDQRAHLKAREIVDLVKQELAILRREFRLAQQMDVWAGTHNVSEQMHPLIEALNETGIPIALRSLILDTIDKQTDRSQALKDIATTLGAGIKSINLLESLEGRHILAGSSGSGKTLMAGRLAKQGTLIHGQDSVAIISYNDSGFGAWNRIQLVGTQAGADTFRATSTETLTQILQELETRKLIIIDTSGEDPQHHVDSLSSLLPEAKKHLVMAADASEASAKRHINPSGFKWDSVMLSRLEPHVYPWAVISCLHNRGIPISLAAAQPTIVEPAVSMTGPALTEKTLSNLPISCV
jgi:flagellar biosynthesis GTPase FlhF